MANDGVSLRLMQPFLVITCFILYQPVKNLIPPPAPFEIEFQLEATVAER